MRQVHFNPDGDYVTWSESVQKQWDRWLGRSKKATDDLLESIKEGREKTFDQKIWADLKDWLLQNIFYKKCAYCETLVTAGFYGEGEHYRPKSSVTFMKDGKKSKVASEDGTPHGGYFWLVYNWYNLVPSCQHCNNQKSDQFPIGKTHVSKPATTFNDLDLEEDPLLIHPYRDDPSLYLRFGANGVVTTIDSNPKGQHTIDVLKLNRPDLREFRTKRMEEAKTALLDALVGKLKWNIDIKDSLKLYVGDEAVYCSAVRQYVNEKALPEVIVSVTGMKV
jgi:5-methylcytosine-specific restriction endonuclease McrA